MAENTSVIQCEMSESVKVHDPILTYQKNRTR